MIHKIIIAEGVDRTGKGTALNELERLYTEKGFNVVSFSRQTKYNQQYSDLMKKAYMPIGKAVKKIPNHLKYDIFALGAMEVLPILLANLHFDKRKHIVLFDRLGLSNIVYGKILRPDEYQQTIFGSEYHINQFIYSCIESLTTFAEVNLFMTTKDEALITEDDNENENVSITKEQIILTNHAYKQLIPILYTLAEQLHSNFKFKHVEICKANGEHELLEKMYNQLFTKEILS